MKRYFIDGKEVNEDVAEGIIAVNEEIMRVGKFEELINCKFVVVIEAA